MIVHWDLEVSTLQVGVRGINSEALTTAPRNLRDVQGDRRGGNARKLTDASLRGVGVGAATTCSANKPRASNVERPVGWSISSIGVLPMAQISVYMGLWVTGAARRLIYHAVYGPRGVKILPPTPLIFVVRAAAGAPKST